MRGRYWGVVLVAALIVIGAVLFLRGEPVVRERRSPARAPDPPLAARAPHVGEADGAASALNHPWIERVRAKHRHARFVERRWLRKEEIVAQPPVEPRVRAEEAASPEPGGPLAPTPLVVSRPEPDPAPPSVAPSERKPEIVHRRAMEDYLSGFKEPPSEPSPAWKRASQEVDRDLDRWMTESAASEDDR
jgi:hypothetical protein